jgi:hypothetical protein
MEKIDYCMYCGKKGELRRVRKGFLEIELCKECRTKN